MANKLIQYTEELVGENHPIKADTLNRAFIADHENDGTHKDANVTAAKLATDAVETAKIKDANVTAAKLSFAAKPIYIQSSAPTGETNALWIDI